MTATLDDLVKELKQIKHILKIQGYIDPNKIDAIKAKIEADEAND